MIAPTMTLDEARNVVAEACSRMGGVLWPNGLGFTLEAERDGVDGSWNFYGHGLRSSIRYRRGWYCVFSTEGSFRAMAWSDGAATPEEGMAQAVQV